MESPKRVSLKGLLHSSLFLCCWLRPTDRHRDPNGSQRRRHVGLKQTCCSTRTNPLHWTSLIKFLALPNALDSFTRLNRWTLSRTIPFDWSFSLPLSSTHLSPSSLGAAIFATPCSPRPLCSAVLGGLPGCASYSTHFSFSC